MKTDAWPRIRKRTYRWQDKSGIQQVGESYSLDYRDAQGKRQQPSFKSQKEAEAEANRLRMERQVEFKNRAVSLARLTDDERLDVMAALKKIEGRGTLAQAAGFYVDANLSESGQADVLAALEKIAGKGTLLQAAEFYLQHNDLPSGKIITVAEAVERYIAQAQVDGLRPRSIEDITLTLKRLTEAFGSRPVAHLSRHDATEWMNSLKRLRGGAKYSQTSRRHFRVHAGALFNWLLNREMAVHNPFEAKSRGRRGHSHSKDQIMPGTLTVQQVRAILNAARSQQPELVPALAIAFFAGLRRNEYLHLEWADVQFEHGLIRVRPEIAKRRQARNVEMQSNLVSWLLPYRKDAGPIAIEASAFRKKFDKVRAAAKCVKLYPHNAARHTFATMHLARFNDAAKTALQLGHVGGIDILFDHYRGMVTPKEAEAYWQIVPSTGGQVIQLREASA